MDVTRMWFMQLGSPQHVVAPMVDASELAWRLLCRKHGAHLCYTPMLHSNVFVRDSKYRKDALASTKEDRPLFVQFCGNDPEVMASAAILAQEHCDAIDVNLGCPQAIAKRGRYGSFLQDDWDLLTSIVRRMTESVNIPITCKVRVFEDISKTVAYAKMLENAGCRLLTVHGRTREQKGPLTGIASWVHIKAVRDAVKVPIFANGNIQCLEDVQRCLQVTGVDGIMSAEGILTNPALFEGKNYTVWELCEEYLDLVSQHPCPTSYVRGHIFKLFHKILNLQDNHENRAIVASAQKLEDFKIVSQNVKSKYLPYHEGYETYCIPLTNVNDYNLHLPPWICQPYVRMSPEEHITKMENCNKTNSSDDQLKRIHEDADGNIITRKKMKKLRRIMRRPPKPENHIARSGEQCISQTCPNPLGCKCIYKLCKQCCRNKCFVEDLDCPGHRILVHTRREMAKKFALQKIQQKEENIL